MDTKLTLKLERKVIEKAKAYAKERSTSLSKIIEKYLKNLTTQNEDPDEITPLVKSLSGVVKLDNSDYKSEYGSYLSEKYK